MRESAGWGLLTLALCGLLWLGACSAQPPKTPQEALASLQEGMTVEAVEDALGDPQTNKDLGPGKRVFVYEVTQGFVVVFFVDGKIEKFNRTDRVEFR